ncbi:MAG: NAD(P)H-dependent oxidoreductase subunit E [Candidatus Omnitrophica bacterium]|nr:NAD(P)H-dependent oxidoreductase subunit E [Candidatus Omnitrophota bacterium]MCF7877528.1 NAD(P)H-dependent oxidoreductase subunit E [Candidatus Omnitrophota bacterium]MCF7891894.1 NAD(P)H-dependent oxidoreductase subunit E [Candidatus Omnitrophota bacterium]MCF7895436.1 NAD(P)H-dependent oxidoreductase subunit E [Candidatus Omnitrophota bacterium]MCF7897947.1 NAD(P)H-dependent oxidoreductase subunit E [Candidatus Omnitrophota bacterium]
MKNEILIIDDDADFVEAISLLLEGNGYKAISAYNGKEGFAKAKEKSPDLIMLDMKMAYKTEGAETAKAMSSDAEIKDIPVILVTGIGKELTQKLKDVLQEEAMSVKKVIEKPIEGKELLKIIKNHIGKDGGKTHRELMKQIGNFVDKWKDKKGNLVMILHEIQNHYGYVPRGISFHLSRLLDVPLARIYEVLTFYNFFKLSSPGEHMISVCMGTACYLKGASELVDKLQEVLAVEEGEITKDGLFSFQLVRCLGCCGLAPVIMIDEKIYPKVSPDKIENILSEYRKEKA